MQQLSCSKKESAKEEKSQTEVGEKSHEAKLMEGGAESIYFPMNSQSIG